jgi:hypothetical protein
MPKTRYFLQSSYEIRNNIEKLETSHQRILDSYELDFAKHAPGRDFPKLQAIWRAVPGQAIKASMSNADKTTVPLYMLWKIGKILSAF